MSSQKTEVTFKSMLLSTGLVQPVSSSVKGGKMSVMCRLVPGGEKRWLEAVHEMLKVTKDLSEDFLFCRRYLLKDGQMVYGWYIQIESKNAKTLEVRASLLNAVLISFAPGLEPVKQVAEPYRPPLSPGQHPTQQMPPPRPPNAPGLAHPLPPGASPQLVTIKSGRDDKGNNVIIEEMPLPHIGKDLNDINAKGRGAKFL